MLHTLEADSINLEFGSRRILSDIHILCRTGEITGLLGRNGQGKTCLMRIIYGDLEASSRSVRFDDISLLHPYRQPEHILYVPQFNFMPESLSLQRVFRDFNLEFGELLQRFPQLRITQKAGIKDLSGGERRLISLYLIIRSKSRFALLDEPFSHLMPAQIETVKEMLVEEKANKGFLITDHLYRHIIDISDKFYILADGRTQLARSMEDIERLGYARL
jgi:ABC-type multidrug transport system ATPase subunit